MHALSVHKVYITWHSPQIKPTQAIKDLVSTKRLVIMSQTTDSLNNRFNPVKDMRTQAVFICDDDIYAPST